jgi:hypothetical protein
MAEIDKALPNISEQPEQTSEDLAVEMEQQIAGSSRSIVR